MGGAPSRGEAPPACGNTVHTLRLPSVAQTLAPPPLPCFPVHSSIDVGETGVVVDPTPHSFPILSNFCGEPSRRSVEGCDEFMRSERNVESYSQRLSECDGLLGSSRATPWQLDHIPSASSSDCSLSVRDHRIQLWTGNQAPPAAPDSTPSQRLDSFFANDECWQRVVSEVL